MINENLNLPESASSNSSDDGEILNQISNNNNNNYNNTNILSSYINSRRTPGKNVRVLTPLTDRSEEDEDENKEEEQKKNLNDGTTIKSSNNSSLNDLNIEQIEMDADSEVLYSTSNNTTNSSKEKKLIGRMNSKSSLNSDSPADLTNLNSQNLLSNSGRKSNSSLSSTTSNVSTTEINNLGENKWEEIHSYKEGKNFIKVRMLNEKDPLTGTITKTTSTFTYYPNGKIEKQSYVEVIEVDEHQTNTTTSQAETNDHDSDLNILGSSTFYNLIRKKYEDDYGLRENQYDTIKDCFDKLDDRDEHVNKYLFKFYIMDQVKERKGKVIATEKQIDRAIETIDLDDDGDIDFNEYLDFMYLFFAKSQNLRRRIVSVLNGRSFGHAEKGYLTGSEIGTFYMFIKKFYGIKKNVQAKRTRMSYREFANWIYPILKDQLFVR